jgi:hypothetical protein
MKRRPLVCNKLCACHTLTQSKGANWSAAVRNDFTRPSAECFYEHVKYWRKFVFMKLSVVCWVALLSQKVTLLCTGVNFLSVKLIKHLHGRKAWTTCRVLTIQPVGKPDIAQNLEGRKSWFIAVFVKRLMPLNLTIYMAVTGWFPLYIFDLPHRRAPTCLVLKFNSCGYFM